eukprot:TRINITY_DN27446_c0_g1_i1.p1 TRINITY_DN27446_c0_g1~~TRINITY_DN27446_c0_g1_i1.p1  ORF type:complete len:433 (+),score=68.26 TRINITY_DN27446_c0_g1_i1:93-1391(+)
MKKEDQELLEILAKDAEFLVRKAIPQVIGIVIAIYVAAVVFGALMGWLNSLLVEAYGKAREDHCIHRRFKRVVAFSLYVVNHRYTPTVLCVLSPFLFLAVAGITSYVIWDAIIGFAAIDGELANRSVAGVAQGLLTSIQKLDQAIDAGVVWELPIRNPTPWTASVDGFHVVASTVARLADVHLEQKLDLEPYDGRSLIVRAQVHSHGAVLGGLLAHVQQLAWGLALLNFKLVFQGTFRGRNFEMEGMFEVPLDMSVLPSAHTWPQSLSWDNVRHALVEGLKRQHKDEKPMLQFHTLRLAGTTFQRLFLLGCGFASLILWLAGCVVFYWRHICFILPRQKQVERMKEEFHAASLAPPVAFGSPIGFSQERAPAQLKQGCGTLPPYWQQGQQSEQDALQAYQQQQLQWNQIWLAQVTNPVTSHSQKVPCGMDTE